MSLPLLVPLLLPNEAHWALRAIGPEALDGLWPLERAASATWHPKRQCEFAAGRQALRDVMAQLGLAAQDLPPGPNRVPEWPAGGAFSLTHTDGWALAVGVPPGHCRGLGVDLAVCKAYQPGVVKRVLHAMEQSQRDVAHPPALYFCVKEALYKAQWALTQAWMDFHDVALRFEADALPAEVSGPGWCRGEFVAEVVHSRPQTWPLGHQFVGRWVMSPQYVLAWVSIPD